MGGQWQDKGEHSNAIPYLEQAANSDFGKSWVLSWSFAYLGTCYFMTSQYDKSKKALNKTLELNATRNSNKYALRRTLLFGLDPFYENWTIDSTAQIRFHFQSKDSLPDAEKYMNDRQKALDNIIDSFPARLPKKIDFFVWDAELDAMRILRRNLGFSDPEYLITHSRKNQTTGHELCHLIIHHALKPKSKSRFINEGIATLYDQTQRDRLKLARETVLEYGDISIEELWTNGTEYPETLVYSVSAAWMEYCYKNLSAEQIEIILTNQAFDEAEKILGEDLITAIQYFELLLKN